MGLDGPTIHGCPRFHAPNAARACWTRVRDFEISSPPANPTARFGGRCGAPRVLRALPWQQPCPRCASLHGSPVCRSATSSTVEHRDRCECWCPPGSHRRHRRRWCSGNFDAGATTPVDHLHQHSHRDQIEAARRRHNAAHPTSGDDRASAPQRCARTATAGASAGSAAVAARSRRSRCTAAGTGR